MEFLQQFSSTDDFLSFFPLPLLLPRSRPHTRTLFSLSSLSSPGREQPLQLCWAGLELLSWLRLHHNHTHYLLVHVSRHDTYGVLRVDATHARHGSDLTPSQDDLHRTTTGAVPLQSSTSPSGSRLRAHSLSSDIWTEAWSILAANYREVTFLAWTDLRSNPNIIPQLCLNRCDHYLDWVALPPHRARMGLGL